MQVSTPFFDRFAIGLSMLCAVHCLVLPLLLVVVPSVASLPLADEAFHQWLVYAVLPISAFALTLGCKQHQRWLISVIGGLGVALLVCAVAIDEAYLSETVEKRLTLAGAFVIAVAHAINYRLCRRRTQQQQDTEQDACHCG